MNKRKELSPPAVGGASLLVVFAVLCMTVFALLSLSTVQANRRLTQAYVQSVKDYYAADCEAQSVLARLRAGEWEKARPYLPDSSFALLQQAAQQGGLLLSPERLECALLPALLRMDIGELAALPGASEGLEHRLYDAIRRSRGFDELWQTAKTKRYPASRLRRMLLCAYLGVTAADQAQPVPYIRVLGMSQAGRALLRDMAEKSALPVVTRPAQIKLLSAPARALFDREVLADDLYRFALPCWRQERAGDSWRRQAVIL